MSISAKQVKELRDMTGAPNYIYLFVYIHL